MFNRPEALFLRLFDADQNLIVLILKGVVYKGEEGRRMRLLDEASLNQLFVSISPFHLPNNFPSFLPSYLSTRYILHHY